MYNIYDIEKINYYLIYNDEKQVLQLILLPWVGTSVMALMCEKARVPGKKATSPNSSYTIHDLGESPKCMELSLPF